MRVSKEFEAVLRDEDRAASAWENQATSLAAKNALGPAVLAEVRAVGLGTAPTRLTSWLAKSPAADPDAEAEAALAAVAKARRFGDGDAKTEAVRLTESLLRGGRPARLLGAVADALEQEGDAIAAMDVARGALAIATEPEQPALRARLADLLVGVGKFEEAHALAALAGPDAKALRTRIAALRAPFEFRAKSYLEGEADDDDPPEVSPLPLAVARAGIRAMFVRVATIRAELVARVGEVAWLPDVEAHLVGDEAPMTDPEAPRWGEATLEELVFGLRVESSRLSWALAALGASGMVVPTAIVKPRVSLAFAAEFTAARHDLLCDVTEGKAPQVKDELDRELLASTWGEVALKDADPALALFWLDETEAALSGMHWAMGRAPTPWAPE